LISFAYERGWRQGFIWAGFPGVEKEFEMGEWALSCKYSRAKLLQGVDAVVLGHRCGGVLGSN
jgi:hypothetical protein